MTTAVSLFAGVGGFDIALNMCGVDVVAAVEIDDQARGVLRHRFPQTALFTDVQEVTGEQLIQSGFDPADGILVGGFPCQDLSVAGRRAGLDGDRSGLFWEIVRLADETKAKWVILENVPGLLSSQRGRDMGIVLGALVDLGYGVSYRVFDAQFFGVPQRRRRVFIVGCLGDDGSASAEVLAVGDSGAGDFEPVGKAGKDVAASVGDGVTSVHRLLAFGHYATDGTFSTLKARDYKDHTDLIVQPVIAFNWQNGGGYGNANPGLAITENGTGPLSRSQTIAVAYSIREDAKANNFSATEIQTARALQSLQPSVQSHHAQTFIVQEFEEPQWIVRRLTPTECERLQGFPDGWTSERYDFKKQTVVEQKDSSRYKQMGNAVAVPVVAWIVNRLLGVSHLTMAPASSTVTSLGQRGEALKQ